VRRLPKATEPRQKNSLKAKNTKPRLKEKVLAQGATLKSQEENRDIKFREPTNLEFVINLQWRV
jgi:hypothetical protein